MQNNFFNYKKRLIKLTKTSNHNFQKIPKRLIALTKTSNEINRIV